MLTLIYSCILNQIDGRQLTSLSALTRFAKAKIKERISISKYPTHICPAHTEIREEVPNKSRKAREREGGKLEAARQETRGRERDRERKRRGCRRELLGYTMFYRRSGAYP